MHCVLFHMFTQRCVKLRRFGLPLRVPIAWNSYRITPIHWLMARMPSSTFSRRFLILANAPSAPQISLPSRSGHISPSVAIFLARFRLFSQDFLCLHFGDCRNRTLFSLQWSAMDYRHCQSPCSSFIASDDPHSKCVKCIGFLNALEAVSGISKCKFCSRRWRASRWASPFLSLSHLSTCARILRLNLHINIYILAWRHAMPFPSG